MLVEAFGRLRHIAPLSEYTYVGLGGLEFVDFELVRRALDIRQMISIEKDTTRHARYLFNRPFSGIEVLGGSAQDHLPLMDWSGLRIVWLDYEQGLDEEVLGDATFLAHNLIPGSVLVITLNAQPTKPRILRRANLASRVGDRRIPQGVDDDALAAWGLAATHSRILRDGLTRTVRDRGEGAEFEQLFKFFYRDGARMQTYGGIIVSPAARVVYETCRFEDLAYVRTGDDAMIINPPVLTTKEALHLNHQLPKEEDQLAEAEWLSDDEKRNYAAVYRWYPTAI